MPRLLPLALRPLPAALGLLVLAAPHARAQTVPMPAPLPASVAPAAKAVLAQAAAAQKALKSLSETITVLTVIQGHPAETQTITLAFLKPDRARGVIAEKSGPVQQISTDGLRQMIYSVPEKQYISFPVTGSHAIQSVLGSLPTQLTFAMAQMAQPEGLDHEFVRPVMVTRLGVMGVVGGVPVDTVTMTLTPPAGSRPEVTFTLGFGHADHLLRRMVEAGIRTRDGKSQKFTITETVTDLMVNPVLSTADFAFTPPADAKRVAK